MPAPPRIPGCRARTGARKLRESVRAPQRFSGTPAECILRPVRKESPVMKRTLPIAVASVVLAGASLLGQAAPSFQVDPLWPKPLPNHWLLGSVTGVAVDAQDHAWGVHRGYDSMTARTEIGAATNPKTADECCVPAPPILEF